MNSLGLTLGKFAPLHRGHQFLIETALAETDCLIVVGYNCPETTSIPLNVRSRWIRNLYPTVEMIEAWDGPTEVGETPVIMKMHEDYLLKILGGRRITHFYSGEFYGDHVSRALGAVNRQVTRDRISFPVSGTQIRQDPFPLRDFIHPTVYRELIINVAFLGAPSTGKTTLAHRLAEEYGTGWMPEYGREYWEEHQVNRRLTLEQLAELAEGHLEREERLLLEANRYLFTDTNAMTTSIFSWHYHNQVHPRLSRRAEEAQSRYDLFFLCDIDIPYDDTWDRSGEMDRDIFQLKVIGDLHERKVPYFILRGPIEERVRQVKNVLARYEKFGNIIDLMATDERAATNVANSSGLQIGK